MDRRSFLIGAGSLFAADLYKLSNVKRLESNLYKADGGLVISTKMCMHMAMMEDAVLRWDGPNSFENKIVWDDGETCAVSSISSTR